MSYECFCDYDPPSWINIRKVKASRKERRCEECGIRIAIGQPCETVTGLWDGSLSTSITCHRCVELREWARISVPCFCWYYGHLHEDVHEMVQEVRIDAPIGFYFEYGRRMVRIKHARAADRAKEG